MNTTTTISIESLTAWDLGRMVHTSNGPKWLRKGFATQEFWGAWREAKEELKAAGVSCSKEKDGQWAACWWGEITHTAEKEVNLALTNSTDALEGFEMPAPAHLSPRGYQHAGVQYMLQNRSTLLADDMGLGKTVQIIGLINADPTIQRVLLVCPASLKLNWGRELKKWLTRDLTVEMVNGGTPPSADANIVVINYDILTRHAEWIHAEEWDLFAADEAHMMKNPKASRTKVIFGYNSPKEKLPQIQARRRVLATGTPIPNRVMEGFGLWNFLRPDLFPSFRPFAMRYCDPQMTAWGPDYAGASNTDELQHILRSNFMIRRTKEQVLTELPGKMRQTIPLTGFAALVAKEAAILGDMGFDYEDDAWGAALKSAPGFEELAIVRHMLSLAKAPSVARYVEELLETQDKVIVMAYHKDVVKVIADKLANHGVVMVTGGTSATAKQDAVDQFQTNPEVRVFVGNINAAGVGLTLTAASQVVFAELDWTPANIEQAEDRANRMGQTKLVNIHYVVAEGSLDQRLASSLEVKKVNITSVMDHAYDVTEFTAPVAALPAVVTITTPAQAQAELNAEIAPF